MSVTYDFDEAAASHADDVANRIDQSGAYIGAFTKAESIRTRKEGYGIHFEFEAPGGGNAAFDVYTKDVDGKPFFGNNQVQAVMALLGLRGLTSVAGKVGAWSDDGKRIEVDGETFPTLCGKNIGLVLQKELYTKQDGKEGFRMNLYGTFHADSRLTASEIKERKVTPEKLERMLRGLKNKDSRKAVAAEPTQASMGLPAGSY